MNRLIPFRSILRIFLLGVLTCSLGRAASAQSIIDARTAEFSPSADHNAVDATGSPVVTSYRLEIYLAGTNTLVQSADLGKPAPATDGMIRVDFVALLATPLATGVTFEAQVSAVGPGGTAAAPRSNTFGFTPPCAPALGASSASLGAGAASASVGVTAGAGCTWTAASNATSWLTVTAGASGAGSGTVSFSASANTAATARAGTLTIAGQTFTVNQAAAPCTYTLGSASASLTSAAGTGSVGITAGTGCAWTAVSNAASWLTVTAGTSGTGNGTISFAATANTVTAARSGTLTIGGQTFTVNQAAASCTYSLGAANTSLTSAASAGSVGVTAGAGCAWTAVSNATSWLTVTAGSSGSGTGTISFAATANAATAARSGTLTIGGQTFTVNQAAAPCSYTLGSVTASLPAAAGTGSVGMTAGTGCAWTAASNATSWLTVTAGASGTGNGTISFSATANSGTAARSGILTIGGQTFTVNQSAATCTYTLGSTSTSLPAAAGSASTGVTAAPGCTWSAVSNAASWLTVTAGSSGTGNGTVSFSLSANPASAGRSGTITIGGQTFTVNQAGATCSYSLGSSSTSLAAAAGTGSVGVTAGTGCAWTAVSSATSWLTVTAGSSGSGGGTVTFAVSANSAATGRTATLTIGGQVFTVNQLGATCAFAVTPASLTAPSAGVSGVFTVVTNPGCAWTSATPTVSWVLLTGSATGPGVASYVITPNPTALSRSATITVAGTSITITQPSGVPNAPTGLRFVRGG